MKNKKTIFITLVLITGIFIFSVIILNNNSNNNTITTSSTLLSNERIGWGIKRNDNHTQPDLGAKNKELIEKYNGIAMGNAEKKYIYLTFDCGYEGGYTSHILDVLKEKNLKGTFFITAHYVNTASDLVERMINEGHIVGNHFPHALMDI